MTRPVVLGLAAMLAAAGFVLADAPGDRAPAVDPDPPASRRPAADALPVLVVPPAEVPDAELRSAFDLDGAYAQVVRVGPFPIVGSDRVQPAALREAAYLVQRMLGERDDVLGALAANRVRLAVMARDEFTTDVPEHADLEPAAYWDRRARGLGATRTRPAVSCGEENLLALDGDPYDGESILVHEFAHAIHQMGLDRVDPTFDRRLQATYDAAMRAGRWTGTYASTNHFEYWAEAVQSYFDTNRQDDSQHNHVNRRAELAAYDPALFDLVDEVFRDNPWRYVSPRDRATDEHLAAFDRSAAPTFSWPPRVLAAWRAHRATERAVLPFTRPGDGATPPTSTSGGASTSVRFENRTDASLRLMWIDTVGLARDYGWLRAGATKDQATFAGHTWVVADADGAAVGWFVAGDTPGRARIGPDAGPAPGRDRDAGRSASPSSPRP